MESTEERAALETFEYRVGRLGLAPGDVLVVKVTRADVSLEQMKRMADVAWHVFGREVRVVIIPHDVDLSVVSAEKAEKLDVFPPNAMRDRAP